MGDGPQQGPADEEALREQLVLDVLAPCLGRPDVQQLARVVPFVDGLGGVDALVALQAQQLAAGPAREHLGHLGLADSGLALEEQWAVEPQGQEDGGGQALVGQVAVLGEGVADVFNGLGGQCHSMSRLFHVPEVGAGGEDPRLWI